MKMSFLLLCFTAAVAFMTSLQAADHPAEHKDGKLRHVVSFKFKEGTSPEKVKEVEQAFKDLKKKIPGIKSLEWGLNNSPEGLNKGATHCFILTFSSEKDRNDYLPHPAHKEFGKLLGPVLDSVMVIDFWAHE